MSDVDLYTLLDVRPDADGDAIKAAIRRERRVWIKRQNAPEPKRRAEAELRVAQLDDAEQVLLDPARRRSYDAGLAQQRQTRDADPPPRASQGDQRVDVSELLTMADEYLAAGNPRLAHESACEAIRSDRRNPRAWAYRGYASMQLNDYKRAESELCEAVRLDPSNTDYAIQLMNAQLELGWHGPADDTLVRAERANPGDPDVRLARAWYCLTTGQPDEAYGALFGLLEVRPDDPAVNEMAARALVDMTMARLTMLRDDFFMCTSKAQISFAQEHLGRASSLAFNNDELRGDIARWLRLADEADRRIWVRHPDGASSLRGGLVRFDSPRPSGVRLVAGVVLAFVVLMTVTSGLEGGAVSLAVIVVVTWVAWVSNHWQPQWKINRQIMQREGGLRWGI